MKPSARTNVPLSPRPQARLLCLLALLPLYLLGPAAPAAGTVGRPGAAPWPDPSRMAPPVPVAAPLTATVQYTITDLGILGSGFSNPIALNDKGEVVGESFTEAGQTGFLWLPKPAYGLPAGMNDLGAVVGAYAARDISDTGFIVGNTGGPSLPPRAAAWRWNSDPQNWTTIDLGTLGGTGSVAFGVNDSGEVVGGSNVSGDESAQAFVWRGAGMSPLPMPDGHTNSVAAAINAEGQIAGAIIAAGEDELQRAARWDVGGAASNLGTWAGDVQATATDINQHGEIVAVGEPPGGVSDGIRLWLPKANYGLGPGWHSLAQGGTHLPEPAINDWGQVVGAVRIGGTDQAVLWQSGNLQVLNDLLDPALGWNLTAAVDINSNGQIVGTGLLNGQSRAFLLTPVPTWTVMLYLDGDNDLSTTYGPILNRLEAAAQNPAVNVIVALDQQADADSAYYEIQPDPNLGALAGYAEGENYWAQAELDMSAPQTLTDFITWAMTNYPTEHYALFVNDHGGGIGGLLVDDASGTHMTLDDLQQALSATAPLAGAPLDVLYMDMCLMAMVEVAYEVRDYASYFVGSEHIQWGLTEPYSGYISGITASSTPAQVATLFVQVYAQTAAAADLEHTLSALDQSQVDGVATAVDDLALALQTHMAEVALLLADVAAQVQRYDANSDTVINNQDTFADLYHLAELIEQEMAAYPDIVLAAQAVRGAVTTHVIAEQHASSVLVNLDNSHGLSIFFPTSSSSFYDGHNNDFAAGTQWGSVVPQASSAADDNAWGPMLVSYVAHTNPEGADVSEPPAPVARRLIQEVQFNVFVPLVHR